MRKCTQFNFFSLLLSANTDTDTVDMGDGFVVEDGDGTEVTITENKELKGSFLFLEMNADEISCGD